MDFGTERDTGWRKAEEGLDFVIRSILESKNYMYVPPVDCERELPHTNVGNVVALGSCTKSRYNKKLVRKRGFLACTSFLSLWYRAVLDCTVLSKFGQTRLRSSP